MCFEDNNKNGRPQKVRDALIVLYFFMYCTALAAWWMTDGPEKSIP